MGIQQQPLRIALVTHKIARNDGQGRVNYEIVRAALDQGYEVTIIATHCAGDIAGHPHARFIHTGQDRLPTELLRNLVFAWSSGRWLRQHRTQLDLVQANGFVTWEKCDVVAAHFIHTAWSKSVYYPYRSLSPYAMYQRFYTFLNSRWEKCAYRSAGRVVAVSNLVARELATLGVAWERIDVIFNGVDTDQFRPGAAERSRFGLPSQVPLALFIGDIRTPRKNLDTVLRALLQVPTLHLAVAGTLQGSPYPEMAEKLGIGSRVFFLGRVSDTPTLMRSVDMFVFPSRYEAHPLVVLEAMASGVPLIVSGTFGASDFLGDGGKILDDPNDVDGLALLMNELLKSPSMIKQMGVAGRQRALEMKWSTMAASYLRTYEELLQSRTQFALAH